MMVESKPKHVEAFVIYFNVNCNVRCSCVWAVRSFDDQTTHRQVHRTHIQIAGIRPQTQNRQMTKQAAEMH
jgi:cyclophilin family peptidyl-prolyl cis-trans isomerase